MNILKKVIVFILLFNGFELFSQEQNNIDASVYLEFQRFFENEIKYQGVKGNWIFGLKEITAYHKFDYNKDGLLDILIEFNAMPIDQGNYTNYYSVLFENINNENFKYVNYIESVDVLFQEFFDADFTFKNRKTSELIQYKLSDFRFVEVN